MLKVNPKPLQAQTYCLQSMTLQFDLMLQLPPCTLTPRPNAQEKKMEAVVFPGIDCTCSRGLPTPLSWDMLLGRGWVVTRNGPS